MANVSYSSYPQGEKPDHGDLSKQDYSTVFTKREDVESSCICGDRSLSKKEDN
jgi:hypothetical protein